MKKQNWQPIMLVGLLCDLAGLALLLWGIFGGGKTAYLSAVPFFLASVLLIFIYIRLSQSQ